MTKSLPRRTKRNELTPEARGYLLDGLAIGFDVDDTDAVRTLWKEHHATLLDEWLSDPANLGRRPHGWWLFSRPHGELRRQLGGPEPLPDSEIHRGIHTAWPCKNLLFETEVEFLHRLGLLTREERARYPELKATARAELKREALRRSQPLAPGHLTTPCVTYTEQQLDALFAGLDEVDGLR